MEVHCVVTPTAGDNVGVLCVVCVFCVCDVMWCVLHTCVHLQERKREEAVKEAQERIETEFVFDFSWNG